MNEWYENLSGLEYNHRLLKFRRIHALTSMKERGGGEHRPL